MSGIKETPVESPDSSTLSDVQKLIFSIGHLKFSMRAISSMHLQSTLLSQNVSWIHFLLRNLSLLLEICFLY